MCDNFWGTYTPSGYAWYIYRTTETAWFDFTYSPANPQLVIKHNFTTGSEENKINIFYVLGWQPASGNNKPALPGISVAASSFRITRYITNCYPPSQALFFLNNTLNLQNVWAGAKHYGPNSWITDLSVASYTNTVPIKQANVTLKDNSDNSYLEKFQNSKTYTDPRTGKKMIKYFTDYRWVMTPTTITLPAASNATYGPTVYISELTTDIAPSKFDGRSRHNFTMTGKAINNFDISESDAAVDSWKTTFDWYSDPPYGTISLLVDNDYNGDYGLDEGRYNGKLYTRNQSIKIKTGDVRTDNPTSHTVIFKVSNDGTTYYSASYSSTKNWYSWSLPAGEGAKIVYVKATDSVGNYKIFTAEVTVDKTLPEGTVGLVGGQYISGETIALRLTASDDYSPASTIGSLITGDVSIVSTNYDIPYKTDYTKTISAYDGTKEVYANFKDFVGNVFTPLPVKIYKDQLAPSASITNPIFGQTLPAVQSISGTAANTTASNGYASPLNGVVFALGRYKNNSVWEFYDNSGNWGTTTVDGNPPESKYWRSVDSLSADGTWQVNSGSLPPAVDWWPATQYRIYAKAFDKAGNGTTNPFDKRAQGPIVTTEAAPTSQVKAFTPSYTSNEVFTVSWVPSSIGADTYTIRYKYNNGAWQIWLNGVNYTSKTFDQYQGEGTYYFNSVATKNGVAETKDTSVPDAQITIDKTAPTGDIVINNGPATGEANVYLTLSATDNLSPANAITMNVTGDVFTQGWIPFQTSYQRALSAGDGYKTIYVQYRDGANNGSATYSRQILKDTQAPNVLTIDSPAGTVSTLIPIRGTVADKQPGSGIAKVEVWIRKSLGGGSYTYWTGTAWGNQTWLPVDNLTPGTGGNPDTWSKTTGLPTAWPSGDTSISIMARATDKVGLTYQLFLPVNITVNPSSGSTTLSLSNGINWISLPYVNTYGNAQGIVDSINSGKTPGAQGTCIEIGRWVTSSGAYQTLSYLDVIGWSGTNFTLLPGEAYYVSIVGSASWNVSGSNDPNFTFNLGYPNGTNIYWISLPYGSTYGDAASIVNDMNAAVAGTVIEIGRKPASGASQTWSYLEGLGWSGTNFSYTPGEGYYISLAKPLSNYKPK